jgi:hypothetical protein
MPMGQNLTKMAGQMLHRWSSFQICAGVSQLLFRESMCGALPEAVQVTAVAETDIAESRPLTFSELRMIIRDEVYAECRRHINEDINGAIRAHISAAADEEVQSARRKIRAFVSSEVRSQTIVEVNKILTDNVILNDIIEKHCVRQDVALEKKAREILDRICDEEKYDDINMALHRSLQRKIDEDMRVSTIAIASLNIIVFGILGSFLLLRR